MRRFSLALLLGLALGGLPARAGLFDRGIGGAMYYGPYTGGHAYSYNVAYSYGFAFSPADTWRRDPIAYPAGVYPYRPYGQPILYRAFPASSVPPVSVPGEDGLPVLMYPGAVPAPVNLPVYVKPEAVPSLAPVPPVAAARPVTIRVTAPYNAEVWLEKDKLAATGLERVFVSAPVTPGKTHVYSLRASWVEHGKPVEQVRVVGVKAGETARVNFLAAP